jgi:HlyD family secretion protein
MLNFLKKPKIILPLIAIIAVAGFFIYKSQTKIPQYETFEVKRGDVVQQVSVTGQVKPAQNIELSFEKNGKIVESKGKVGDKVKNGQILASLDNMELKAQLAQANAGTQTQQAKLDELKKGTRPEEIQVAQTTLSNAQKSLTDAETNLQNTKNKADADLKEEYDAALTAANDSVTNAIYSLFVLTDIQYTYFQSTSDTDSINVAEAKADAIYILLGEVSGGRATNNAITQMTGGAKKTVQTAQDNPTFANIDYALTHVKNALQKVKSALDIVPTTSLSSTNKTNLNTEKTSVNADITAVSGKVEAIAVQKATNQNNITAAQISLTTAQNTLANAQTNLVLKQAGSTPEQIAAADAQVKQAQANAMSISAQLAKTYIKSPVDGIITQQDAKIGQMATANQTLITIMSDTKFEIEANVSETEIAKISLSDDVSITLDSLGPNEKFIGRVIKIDPAETIISGVIYYKTTLVFNMEDTRIKSGMTANLDIKTDERKNVLILPYYVIKQKGDVRSVQQIDGKIIKDITIEIGLEGETMVEITSGLKDGEKIIVEK